MHTDEQWMERALTVARRGGAAGEVPVGALAVHGEEVLAEAHNLTESEPDATAHAEMLVLRAAAARLGSWRLTGVTIYCTLEPCPMCAYAMVLARVDACVYGAADPKKGAVDTRYDVLRHVANNHRVAVRSGVLSAAAGQLLQDFFLQLRGSRKEDAPL
jgi:tRNA(adenine34) deaminase